jgi:succinoglycan biosynthesis protein ExoM
MTHLQSTQPDTAVPGTRSVVAIATYKRKEGLTRLLASLSASIGEAPVRVVVVDNDPAGSAAATVAKSPIACEYVHETTPGIAAARNAAVAALTPQDDAIIFVDDDESVEPEWFGEMVRAKRESRADVIVGPVLPRYQSDVPRWVVRGGFFVRPRYVTGAQPKYPATNNVLIRACAIARMPDRSFSQHFSMTGGSDSDFFRRLRASGGTIEWLDSAVVHEDVPGERTTLRWIWRRNVRLGNVAARVTFHGRPRVMIAAAGAARCVYGGAMALFEALRGRGLTQSGFGHIARGVGMVSAAVGSYVEEYRR